jgi:hypothetical protein
MKTKIQDNRYNAFNKKWFDKYQNILIILLNFPILKLLIRWIFRIHHDVKYSQLITDIQPNFYSVYLGKGRYKRDIRTHPKFSKRIYFSLKWVWLFFHKWDEFFADEYIPELSFGFSTLTFYPDASGGGSNTSCDGYVQRAPPGLPENFSTIRNSAGTQSNVTDAIVAAGLTASTTTNTYSILRRQVFTFDTLNSISGITINDASLYLAGYATISGLGDVSLCIVTMIPNNPINLDSSDYNIAKWDMTLLDSISMSNFQISDNYNSFGVGKLSISLTNNTVYGGVIEWDQKNISGAKWSSGQVSALIVDTADNIGTSKDPKLIIDYRANIRRWSAMIL